MANFKYRTSTSGSWLDVPSEAQAGTYEGGPILNFPFPSQYDGLGRPCAAIGLPTIKISSTLMTGCGLGFWQSFFSSSTARSASVWLKAFVVDTTSIGASAWVSCSGYMARPTWQSVRIGPDNTQPRTTYYANVEIVVNNCDTNSSA